MGTRSAKVKGVKHGEYIEWEEITEWCWRGVMTTWTGDATLVSFFDHCRHPTFSSRHQLRVNYALKVHFSVLQSTLQAGIVSLRRYQLSLIDPRDKIVL